MPTAHDVAFGRVALAAGLVPQDVLRQVYEAIPPGRPLGDELVARRLLTVEQARWVQGEVAKRSAGEVAVAHHVEDSQATVSGTARGAAPPRQPGELPQPGDVIEGRYRLTSVLGQGGMGAVYRAQDTQRGEDVAVKVMLAQPDENDGAVARFRREAEAVVRVDGHAGIVRVRAFGSHHGAPYAVQDLVEGRDLHAIVKEDGPLPIQEALTYTEGVARAMHHCHQKGVLHRDLKPANILLRTSDKTPHVTDFGLALDAEAERLTKTGEVMGTPAYMSPEQAEGLKDEVDAQTDVYALGAILYELVTGRAPFEGDQVQILKQVFMNRPAPVGEHRPDASAELDAICQVAMAKEKGARYADAAAFANDVGALLRGEPIKARPPSGWTDFKWRVRKRERVALATVTAAFLLVIAAPAGGILYWLATGKLRVLREAIHAQLPKALDVDPLEDAKGEAALLRDLANRARSVNGDAAGEDHVAYVSGLVARARKGERSDPTTQLLVEAGPATIDLLDRLVTRVGFQRGAGWAPSEAVLAQDDPEARLFRALRLLRFHEPPGDEPAIAEADRRAARALLEDLARGERGPAAHAAKLLAPTEELVKAHIEAGGEKLLATLAAGKTLGSGWGSFPTAEALGALPGSERYLWVLAGEAKLAPFLELMTRLRAHVEALTPTDWKKGVVYDRLTALCREHLLPFTDDATFGPPLPKQTTNDEYGKLLSVVVRSQGGASTRGFGAFMEVLRFHVDVRTHPALVAVRKKLEEDLALATVKLLGERRGDGAYDQTLLELMMSAPPLGVMPVSASQEVLIKKLLRDGQFEAYLARKPSGDGFYLWALALDLIEGREDPSVLKTTARIGAQALGDALSDDLWGRLHLGERLPVPEKTVRLSPHWVAAAYEFLADLAYSGDLDPENELERLQAGSELDELSHARLSTLTMKQQISCLRRMAHRARRLSGRVSGDERAAAFAREARTVDQGRALVWETLRRKQSGELTQSDEMTLMEHLVHQLVDLETAVCNRLRRAGQADQALAHMLEARTKLEALGGGNEPDMIRSVAWLCMDLGKADQAEAETDALERVARRDLETRGDRRADGEEHLSHARCLRAHIALHRGDRERAKQIYVAATRGGQRVSPRPRWDFLENALGLRRR